MRDVRLEISAEVSGFLRDTIRRAGGNEVFFLGRVRWETEGQAAVLHEVDVLARGNQISVPAIIEHAGEWDVALHNHPGGDLEPSGADIDVASELGNRGVGFAIIDNDAERLNLVVPPMRRAEGKAVDPEEVRWILGASGPLARELDGYESREGQVEMALEVTRCLNEDGIVACEAGTGVGKSFAYLVPSILWAVGNRERVVVSTGTIHLQEQLVNKDLPFLERVLDIEFRYALIKGRSNYACRRKISELPEEFLVSPPGPDDQDALEQLIDWAKTTSDGSRADLPADPRYEIWEKVMSETDKSLKVNCKFYTKCFYYQAKRRVNATDIVVANHHLFFADLSVRHLTGDFSIDLVLPGYRRVVFDEAHHLEDVCSDHFGARFSRRGVRRRISRMLSDDGRRGRLAVLGKKLRRWGATDTAETIERNYARFLPEIADRIDESFAEIEQLALDERPTAGSQGRQQEEASAKIRLRPETSRHPFWVGTRAHLGAVRSELELIVTLNDRALEGLERAELPESALGSARLECESFGSRLEALILDLDRFCDDSDATMARWVDPREDAGRDEGGAIGFAAVPIRVAEHLSSALYKPLKSVILTSATLSVAGKPDFLSDRLGFSLIPGDRFAFREFPSPFNFQEQVLTVAPVDIPDPSMQEFESELPRLLLDLLRASGGRAFVLFTSYNLLRRTHAQLEQPLAAMGLRPLAQGQAQRSELLRRFRDGGNCVLFGTDSFWEGVDVKGRALECVIITRLPFRVPSEPLQQARLEEISARGMNPFMHFTVPQAVLRFKQGFGRLIRSSRDRGVVAILDSRVLTRRYGKVFLRSLPATVVSSGPAAEMVRRVEQFFGSDRAGATGRESASPGRQRREG